MRGHRLGELLVAQLESSRFASKGDEPLFTIQAARKPSFEAIRYGGVEQVFEQEMVIDCIKGCLQVKTNYHCVVDWLRLV